MSMYICVPEYVFVFVWDYMSGVCSRLWVYACICVSVSVCVHMYIYGCVYLMYMCMSEFIFVCTYMFMALCESEGVTHVCVFPLAGGIHICM